VTRIYLRLNVWTIEQYRANCSNGTDTAFHRTYSCYKKTWFLVWLSQVCHKSL